MTDDLSAYLPKVRIEARKVWRKYGSALEGRIELEDLYQLGVVGLLTAARRWSPERGASLWTFAEQRVRGTMVDHIRQDQFIPLTRKKLVTPKPKLEELGEIAAIQTGVREVVDRGALIKQMIRRKQRAGGYVCER